MATEQVQQWISNDVRISKQITSFEIDFANGYSFAEILRQYGYIDDLSSFSKKSNKEAKVKNFSQIEKVLRQLKVKFDAKLVNQIMNEERGAALRLLYQIKLGIQKANPEYFPNVADTIQNKTMSGLDKEKIDKKFEETMQLRQTLMATKQYQSMNKSKKLEPIEKTLLRFEHAKKELDDKALRDHREEENLLKRLQQEQRQKAINTMSENKQFMKEWEDEGRQNWQKNQNKRQETINRQKYFEDKEVQDYKNKLMKELDEATKEMIGGIDEFEKNLQKLGIEKNTNIEDALKRMEEKKGIPPGQIQNFSYAATMNKIKESKNLQDFAAKERDRRRRKLIVDQARTQHDLDKKKNEEQLIQKLLKKQNEEQQFAYVEWRSIQCKELIVKNRQEKAQIHMSKKEIQMQELERKRNEEQAAIIDSHKNQIKINRKNYQQQRMQEKLEKRKLNIEICSEVIDLILDVANEAFDQTSKRKNKKLEKAEWRQWMKIFVDNKLVSSVVGENRNNLSQALEADEQSHLKDHSVYDPINDYNKDLGELLDELKYDPAFEDLLQYLSVSGNFYLTSSEFEQDWNQMKSLNIMEGLNMDFEFLNSLIPPGNPELGRTLQHLLMNIWKEETVSDKGLFEALGKKDEAIPHYLPLKLCILGGKYSGKRTIAKQLQDHFQNRIKIFKMEEIIKEVYDYVNPNMKFASEQVPQSKKGPPAKKEAEPTGPVDIYAGQDTKEYKEIGNQIKTILGDNFDFAAAQQSQQDSIISLIPDDALLVRLFIQKLKLSFPPDKTEQQKLEELKANIQREKEISDQLAEIEQQNALAGGTATGGAISKGKNQPKAAAKGQGSNEDQLRQELEQVTKIQPEGWILLDFPRTLSQAKLMEKIMSGYTCLVDQLKTPDQRAFETWSKLITPSGAVLSQDFDGEPKLIKGATDAFLFLDVWTEECIRRNNSRKIDPQTGIIYHMEDSPPPENDNKLKDRLQDYFDPDADLNRIINNHQIYDENKDSLKAWIAGFGLKDSEINEAVSSSLRIYVENRVTKQEVLDRILQQINGIIAFKQAEHDIKKQRVMEQMTMEATINIAQAESLQQQSFEVLQNQQNQEDQIEVSPSQVKMMNAIKSPSVYDRSRQSQRPKSDYRFTEFSTTHQPLTETQRRDEWQTFEQSYYRDCLSIFKTIRRQRELVFDGLNDIQQKFIDFLQRPDSKSNKINDFINSFNKFSEEFPDLRKDQQTKEELLHRVDKLNNDLWSIIVQRKDEALAEHQRIIANGWIEHEMKKLIKNANTIIQSEINKFNTVYKIIVGFESTQGFYIESQFNSLVDQGLSAYDKNNGNSPLIMKLMGYILKIIQYQQQTLSNLDPIIAATLELEQKNLIFRLNMIQTWITLKLREFYTHSSQVLDILDDWVLISVEEENKSVQTLINKFKQAVIQQTMRIENYLYRLDKVDISVKINQIQFSSTTMTPIHSRKIQLPSDMLSLRFQVDHLEQLYKDILYYSYDYYLDGQTFIHLIVLYMKENRLPYRWRFFDFSQFNNLVKRFSVIPLGHKDNSNTLFHSNTDDDENNMKREFIDWKTLFTMFILLQTAFDNEDALNQYASLLQEAANQNEEITLKKFIEIPSWLDEYESQPESLTEPIDSEDEDYDEKYQQEQTQDLQRLAKVKTLLFQVHQTNTRILKVQSLITCLQKIYNDVSNCASKYDSSRGDGDKKIYTCHYALFEQE